VQFLPPLADASDFPAPQIRALPADKQHTASVSTEQISGHKRLLYVKARHALYHIARATEQSRVWLPAYHCPALVEPFLAAGKAVLFYSLNTDLTPDMNLLSQELKPGEMVVTVRYFGFDCGADKLAALCREKDCILVEDLAHAALATKLYGDLAVTSLVKFYPVSSGAELWLPEDSSYQKAIKQQYDALPGQLAQGLKELVRKLSNRIIGAPKNEYRYFDASAISRCLNQQDRQYLACRPATRISATRRKHYQSLVEQLQGSSRGRVLFETLPENVSPYVVPFLLNDESGFAHLRRNSIQIYRWEEMVSGQCDVSLDYRQRLVQLPCHQDLTQQQLQTIAEVLR
jgi:perosamine synthetase